MYEVPVAHNASADDYLTGQAEASIETQENDVKNINEQKAPGAKWLNSNASITNDTYTRISEDPLLAIKKKEMEMRAKILQNPVQMKKIKEKALQLCKESDKIKLLQSIEKREKEAEEAEKRHKHHHKHHHKHKHRSSSSRSRSRSRSRSKHNKHHNRSRSKSNSKSNSYINRIKKEKKVEKKEYINIEKGKSKKLSKEERDARIAEMLNDGKLNEELRWNRIMNDKKEEEEEEKSMKNPEFLKDINKQAYSVDKDNTDSVSDRIRRRKNFYMDMKNEQ